MAGNGQEIIVVRRVKKISHGGHHGGAWKVAYADFVTAMMALFLVLWLVAMLSIDSRKAVAEYFRSYTIFKGTEAGGAKGVSMMKGNPVKLDPEDGGLKGQDKSPDKRIEVITVKLNKIVEDRLQGYKDQILIFTTREGVRLEITEKEQRPMFELGKARLLPTGQEVMAAIADVLRDFPNTISIEGHTDRSQYPSENYTNWELAADRANAARRELIKDGITAENITRVTSFASAVPLKGDPFDPMNRRVSILVEPR